MRWVYGGKTNVLPCRAETQLDVVPVDYVCDALLGLAARDDTAGGTYHLTAGPGRGLSIGEMVERAVAEGNRYHAEIGGPVIEAPQIVSPELAEHGTEEQREQLAKLFALGEQVMRTHVPYMLTEQLFDATRTRAALDGTGIECPPLGDYYERLVRYGVERNFGDG
jgi:hypothetical protein